MHRNHYIHCTRPLAVVHSLHTPARSRTFTAHARSQSYIHCTRPLAVVHSLYTPARSRTFTAHARSLSYIHCTRPLAVVHSLYTPARSRTFTVHARSQSYIHCTRPLAVVHSLHTPARSRTFTVHARSQSYIHCTRPLVHARYSLSSSCFDGTVGWSAISTVSFVTDLVVYVENPTSDTSVADLGVCPERQGSISAFSLYSRVTTDDGPAMTVNDTC